MKKEIELKFETDLPGEEYKLENNVFQLPLISTPEKLNQLLNKLLSFDPPKKFINNRASCYNIFYFGDEST